jgi:hypothetical protein
MHCLDRDPAFNSQQRQNIVTVGAHSGTRVIDSDKSDCPQNFAPQSLTLREIREAISRNNLLV